MHVFYYSGINTGAQSITPTPLTSHLASKDDLYKLLSPLKTMPVSTTILQSTHRPLYILPTPSFTIVNPVLSSLSRSSTVAGIFSMYINRYSNLISNSITITPYSSQYHHETKTTNKFKTSPVSTIHVLSTPLTITNPLVSRSDSGSGSGALSGSGSETLGGSGSGTLGGSGSETLGGSGSGDDKIILLEPSESTMPITTLQTVDSIVQTSKYPLVSPAPSTTQSSLITHPIFVGQFTSLSISVTPLPVTPTNSTVTTEVPPTIPSLPLPRAIVCSHLDHFACSTRYGCVNLWTTEGEHYDQFCSRSANLKFCSQPLVEFNGLIGDCCYENWCNDDITFPTSKLVNTLSHLIF